MCNTSVVGVVQVCGWGLGGRGGGTKGGLSYSSLPVLLPSGCSTFILLWGAAFSMVDFHAARSCYDGPVFGFGVKVIVDRSVPFL